MRWKRWTTKRILTTKKEDFADEEADFSEVPHYKDGHIPILQPDQDSQQQHITPSVVPTAQPTIIIPIFVFPNPNRQRRRSLATPDPLSSSAQQPAHIPIASEGLPRKRRHEELAPPTSHTTPTKDPKHTVVQDMVNKLQDRPIKRRRIEWKDAAESVAKMTLIASLSAAATFAGLLFAAE